MDVAALDGLFFHEDQYEMQQILPASNAAFIKKQCWESEDFSKRHLAENGIGWTDVMILEEVPNGFATLELKTDGICNILMASFSRQSKVYSGTPNDVFLLENIIAYGHDSNCAFLVEEQNNVVSGLSMVLSAPTDGEHPRVLKVWEKLSRIAELIYVDWGWDEAFALDDAIALEDYLNRRHVQFRKDSMIQQEES